MSQIEKKKTLLFGLKKGFAGCLAVALMLGSVMLPVEDVSAATPATVDYDSEYDISKYWSSTDKKVPVKDGYVFAGWYRLVSEGQYKAIKSEELEGANLSEVDAVAKFVPAYVLSVKTQVSKYVSEKGKNVSALRILSSVDSTKYQEVGFDVQLGKRAHNHVICPSVFSAVQKGPKVTDGPILPEETFGPLSDYFMAVDINDISAINDVSIIYARPYWITLDGTKVEGLARNNRVEDHDNDYICQSINLLHTKTEVAVGKIQVSYNADAYELVPNKDEEKVDAGRIFPKLMYMIDEEKGIISFVGHGTELDQVIVADGIFANLRFVKKTDAPENADLQWNIDTNVTQFCDWEETFVEGICPQ